MNLAVSELFGPTVQGEGPTLGRRCMFLRLAGCNLDCQWCDTPYTWDWTGKNGTTFDTHTESKHMALDDVYEALTQPRCDRVVITGGEPMLQQRALLPLIEHLVSANYVIEIETNGTRPPLPRLTAIVGQFNVSPKLANSGITHDRAWHLESLRLLAATGNAIFKFVVQQAADLDEVAELAALVPLPANSVWIMPEGRNHSDLAVHLDATAEVAIARGWNLTTRLHIHLWGNRRRV